jgi:hypothetical protein
MHVYWCLSYNMFVMVNAEKAEIDEGTASLWILSALRTYRIALAAAARSKRSSEL